MVLFGAYHTAERFIDHDRLTAHFPGPGSYRQKSAVEGAPVPRFAVALVRDGCIRSDGSVLLFRERDSWVRGSEGPKGLTSLSRDDAFTSPSLYRPEEADRFVQRTTPAAFLDTGEARYLSPCQRYLTPDHERAAKGNHSPGPGTYYPSHEAWDFAPPEGWDDVNKVYRSKSRRFNKNTSWGDATMVRPPSPALASQVPSKEERSWLKKRRGSIRPRTAPRCMWIQGVTTSRGLQGWGTIATKVGPMNVRRYLDRGPFPCFIPGGEAASERRGPVHSSEERATSTGFREVRYLDRERMSRGVGAAKDTPTPGPGTYNVRPRMTCGTKFAVSKARVDKTAARTAALESAKARVADSGQHRGIALDDRGGVRPCPPAGRSSQRIGLPLRGRESPGPAYGLPSDFDLKRLNAKVFQPPPCTKKSRKLGYGGRGRKRVQGASVARPTTIPCCPTAEDGRPRPGMSGLSRAQECLIRLTSDTSGAGASALAVPVSTRMGRGFLLAVRGDGMSFVRLPWGVLYTKERLAFRSMDGYEEISASPAAARGGVEENVNRETSEKSEVLGAAVLPEKENESVGIARLYLSSMTP